MKKEKKYIVWASVKIDDFVSMDERNEFDKYTEAVTFCRENRIPRNKIVTIFK